ncbi:MAG: bifunctional nuclease family protein [Planctomycetaceae bacterium]
MTSPLAFFTHWEFSVAVRMELTRVVACDLNDQHWIHLTEVNGSRTFPIVIGSVEAQAINRRLLDPAPFRPLTHQLLLNVIEALGGRCESLVINRIKEHTYYASIHIRVGESLREIDCRPSDGVAVAVHHDPVLPIFVEEEVLRAVVGT